MLILALTFHMVLILHEIYVCAQSYKKSSHSVIYFKIRIPYVFNQLIELLLIGMMRSFNFAIEFLEKLILENGDLQHHFHNTGTKYHKDLERSQ